MPDNGPEEIDLPAIRRRRRMEDALRASQNELLEKNAALAAALEKVNTAQARLIQQEKLAGIGQLAAGVAHEINNPLGYVTANIETLAQNFAAFADLIARYRQFRQAAAGAGAPELKGLSDDIAALEGQIGLDFILADFPALLADTEDGLKRISDIVQGMRFFARVDPRRTFEPVDFAKCIDNTLLIAHSEIKYHAAVATDLADLPAVEAVSGEIHQVILNLIVNAAHAIKEKAAPTLGLIKITAWRQGDSVACSVEDNGTGIDDAHLGDIFNPFFTTKPVGQGTGMGLAICYDIIVRRHHGDIAVDSAPGQGAKFTITLPIKQAGSPMETAGE